MSSQSLKNLLDRNPIALTFFDNPIPFCHSSPQYDENKLQFPNREVCGVGLLNRLWWQQLICISLAIHPIPFPRSALIQLVFAINPFQL